MSQKKAQPIKNKTPRPRNGGRETAEQRKAREWMLAKLRESGLNAADADALGFKPYTAAESADLGLSREGEGFKLSYFDEQRNQLPIFRYRFRETVAPS